MAIIAPQNAGYAGENTKFSRPAQKTGTPTTGSIEQYKAAPQTKELQSPFASMMADAHKAQGKALLMPNAQEQQSGAQLRPTVDSSHGAKDQRMAQANLDKHHLQTLEQLGKNMGTSDNLLDVARNDVTMRNLRTVMGSFNLRAPVTPMADSIKASALAMQHRREPLSMSGKQAESAGLSLEQNKNLSLPENKKITLNTGEIGKLSQQFESGKQGISAIGYDRVGGTSYGKYQIASRVGSMDNFLNFLDTNAPDISEKLRAAGPSNTGSRQGAMPDVWRQIAADEPQRFEALQEKFIYDSHYKPAVTALRQRSDLNGDEFSPAMQEVLFSTAVQHGPTGAARIFSNAAALSGSKGEADFDSRLIDNIYSIRSEQFGASTTAVQASARNRMQQEKNLALAMLHKEGSSTA